jgi:hypothetical protein
VKAIGRAMSLTWRQSAVFCVVKWVGGLRTVCRTIVRGLASTRHLSRGSSLVKRQCSPATCSSCRPSSTKINREQELPSSRTLPSSKPPFRVIGILPGNHISSHLNHISSHLITLITPHHTSTGMRQEPSLAPSPSLHVFFLRNNGLTVINIWEEDVAH